MLFLVASIATICLAQCAASAASAGVIILYEQDFETPNVPSGFSNGFGSGYADLSQQRVNDLFGGQPLGFQFNQQFVVETMLLTGQEADAGSGYMDITGKGGNYAIGMLCCVQNDLLGLSFNTRKFVFFNVSLDISSVGLFSGYGAPLASGSDVPEFLFTLYDDPAVTGNLTGNSTVLDSGELVGPASPNADLVWTTGKFAFDATGSSNGMVILRVDLIEGGYAVIDNWVVAASDTASCGIRVLPCLQTGGLVALPCPRP